MNPVLTEHPSQPSRLTRAGGVLIVLAIAAAVVLALSRTGLDDTPSYRSLTVENPTPYIINIEVTGAERDGWFDVGSVRRENRQTFEETPDPGEQWVFRFSYGGADAGELAVSRDELEGDGWRVTVPAETAERLREAGLSESVR
ncbi:MAG TPA: hypothetical protein VNT52_10805 [Acidimicrobiales bacterium]|nr:hypothetical protein [Acidimicrobiales bacterium]